MIEFLGVGVVAGIDSDLVDPFGRFHRGFRFEMDVGHDRHVAAALAQTRTMCCRLARVFHRGRRDAHDLAAHLRQLDGLLIDASVSMVSQVIIDWTRIGLSPPTPTLPTFTSRVLRRR